MSTPCQKFRERLERALGGGPSAPTEALRNLSWHEHLLGCADCRALLEAEEVLETLLATLPTPRLPEGVARRVLARLEHEREAAALDRLLEVAGATEPPAGLADKVLARLEGARADAALDRLLGALPAPVAPRGLSARVLSRLAAERAPRPAPPSRHPAPSPLALGLRLAAALALLVGGGLGLRALLGESTPARDDTVAGVDAPQGTERAADVEVPSAELLESLELLEAWELITDDSLDVVLTSLDTVDEVLLEIDDGRDPLAASTEEPSKG